MNPWGVIAIVFLVTAGFTYVLLSLWAGRQSRKYITRIKKYTGPW